MPLTVLSVAYPLAAVGPDEVGGAEQVLAMLDETLVRTSYRRRPGPAPVTPGALGGGLSLACGPSGPHARG